MAVCVGALHVGPLRAEPQKPSGSYDAKGKRDPFVPLVRDGRLVSTSTDAAASAKPSDIFLAGILWDPGGRSIALINDAEVTVGETINDYQVLEIRQDAVVLDRGGNPVVLQLMFDEHGKSANSHESNHESKRR